MPATIVAKKAFVRKEDELIPFSTSPPTEPVPEAEEVKVPFVPHDKYVLVETNGMKLWEVVDWQDIGRFIVIADTSERAIALVIEENYDLRNLVATEILVAFENEGIVAEEY